MTLSPENAEIALKLLTAWYGEPEARAWLVEDDGGAAELVAAAKDACGHDAGFRAGVKLSVEAAEREGAHGGAVKAIRALLSAAPERPFTCNSLIKASEDGKSYEPFCSFKNEIDRLKAANERKDHALRLMVLAVCGETGFASAVRNHSGLQYPWPALDIAEEKARAALEPGHE